MNKEICCITNEEKTARNEWENDDSDFLTALNSVYKKIRTIFFHTLLTNHSIASYKYFKKLISEVWTLVLGFLKILHIHKIPIIKLLNIRKRKIDLAHHRMLYSICTGILPHAHWKSPERAWISYKNSNFLWIVYILYRSI